MTVFTSLAWIALVGAHGASRPSAGQEAIFRDWLLQDYMRIELPEPADGLVSEPKRTAQRRQALFLGDVAVDQPVAHQLCGLLGQDSADHVEQMGALGSEGAAGPGPSQRLGTAGVLEHSQNAEFSADVFRSDANRRPGEA